MTEILQGRYSIVRPLGRGGRGAVFLCNDLRLPGKQWAIKEMNPPERGLEDRFREMFEREAATLSSLRHPNLPVIVDYFQERGGAFLVMEYIEGENLAQYVRQAGPLGEGEAFRHGAILLDLLVYLHRHDPPIIFRDLKPENVMRTRSGDLKLIDFGLARHYVDGQHHDTVQAGSVGYASPEQWEDLTQTDERSDIYSWGATMVFLLTGRVPNPHLPLSALRTIKQGPSVNGLQILSECLQPVPDDRHDDAAYLGKVVRRHLQELGVTPPPPPRGMAAAPSARPLDGSGRPQSTLRAPEELGAPSARTAEEGHDATAESTDSSSAVGSASGRLSSTTGTRRTGGPSSPTTDPPSSTTSSGLVRTRATPTREMPREPDEERVSWLRTLGLPLLLITLATIGLLALLLPKLRGTPPPVMHSPSPNDFSAGVPPYRRRFTQDTDLEEGRRLYAAGKWTEAIARLDVATTRWPEDAEAHVLKQNAYIKMRGEPYVRLPYIGTFTGADGPEAYSHLYGMALGQIRVNQEGGIRGRRVVLDYFDDESSTTRCLEIARALLQDPQVAVVLGPTTSQRTLAVAPMFNAARVNLIAPAASAASVWSAGPYVFTASDGREPRVKAMALHATRASGARIAVVHDATSMLSREMATIFSAEASRHDSTCLDAPPYEDENTTFAPQVEFIQSHPPTAVFLSEYRGAPIARFALALRQAGVTVPIMTQAVPYARDLVEIGGTAVNGLVTTEYFHPQIDTPNMHAFMRSFRREFGDVTPPYASANSFDAFTAAVAGLEQGEGREAINAYLRATGVTRPAFEGVGGRFALGKRLDARPVWLIDVESGRYRLRERLSARPDGAGSP